MIVRNSDDLGRVISEECKYWGKKKKKLEKKKKRRRFCPRPTDFPTQILNLQAIAHMAVFPAESLAAKFTSVLPIGNNEPFV